jgi:hypothetical protein
VRVCRQPVQHRQVGLADGAQVDRGHRAMMADGLPARGRGLASMRKPARGVLNSARVNATALTCEEVCPC